MPWLFVHGRRRASDTLRKAVATKSGATTELELPLNSTLLPSAYLLEIEAEITPCIPQFNEMAGAGLEILDPPTATMPHSYSTSLSIVVQDLTPLLVSGERCLNRKWPGTPAAKRTSRKREWQQMRNARRQPYAQTATPLERVKKSYR